MSASIKLPEISRRMVFLFSTWQVRRALQCQRQCSPRPTQPRRHAAGGGAMTANSDATIGEAKRRRQSSRRHRCMPPGRLFFPGRFVGASVPPLANVSCTPHRASCGLACEPGVWWFWPRKHHQLASDLLRIRGRLAWSWRPSDEAALATWPAPTLRRPRQRRQQRSTGSLVSSMF